MSEVCIAAMVLSVSAAIALQIGSLKVLVDVAVVPAGMASALGWTFLGTFFEFSD